MKPVFAAVALALATFLVVFLSLGLFRNDNTSAQTPQSQTAQSPAQMKKQAEITDAVTVRAFTDVVEKQGFNCPRVVSLIKLDYQTERGQPFMVTCSGNFFYRVTVQPRGTAMVELWK